MPRALIEYFVKISAVPADRRLCELTKNERKAVITNLKKMTRVRLLKSLIRQMILIKELRNQHLSRLICQYAPVQSLWQRSSLAKKSLKRMQTFPLNPVRKKRQSLIQMTLSQQLP